MTLQVRNRISFAVMALLVFIGGNLLFVGQVSSGPHRDISFGPTGWLMVHRYGEAWLPQRVRWFIEDVSFMGLLGEVTLACLLTGILWGQ